MVPRATKPVVADEVVRFLLWPARAVFILLMISGGMSLGRLDERFLDWGIIAEFRFLAVLTIGVLLAGFSLVRARPNVLHREFLWWLVGVVMLHGFAAISWLWSLQTEFSSYQFYELCLLTSAVVFAISLFRDDVVLGIRLMIWAYIAAAAVLMAVSVVALGKISGELALLGAGGIGTARLLAMAVIGCVFLYLRGHNLLFILPLPFLLAGIMLSGSRAAALALVFGLAVLFGCRKKISSGHAILSNLKVFFGVVAGLIVIGLFFLTPFGRVIFANFVLSGFVGNSGVESGAPIEVYYADRDVIFADAWTQFADSFFTGIGIGSYTGPFGELYPHNLPLNFAVDCGVVGLIGIIMLMLLPLWKMSRSSDPFVLGALSCAVFFVVASLFAGTYYDARFVWFFLALGFIRANDYSKIS